MCGILAFFSSNERISPEVLQNANRTLRHRGPDNQSVWVDPDGQAGLGHARLSLLDLSPLGDQPFTWKKNGNSETSKRESLKLVHNGEFYDFERIKNELEARGHRFKTRSDSEILLPLYEEFGTAALSHLRGEFAFVLWDRDNRSVFAARDRFGIKPLYYSVHQGKLYFASEVKALFALGVPAQWDSEGVYQFQSTWIFPRQKTLYKNVFQVPPGHYLLASADSGFDEPQVMPYWDFDYPVAEKTENRKFNLEEEVLRFRKVLEEAIQLRLRADVPVGCYLSGGLDSCSLLGMASKQVSTPMHAFTLSFVDQKEYDESDVAQEMAKFTNSVYHEVPIRWQDLSDNFANALWHSETPFINTHGVAKFLLSEAVRKEGIKAVLTGEGSDEIFAGYAHFRKDLLLQRAQGPELEAQLDSLAEKNQVSKGLLLAKETPPSLAGLNRTLGFVPSFLQANGLGAQASVNLLRNDYKQRYENRDSWKCWLNEVDVSRQLTGRSILNQSLYLWSRTMLPSYLLTVLGDRMEMAHSVEGRVPFLDHKVVEHVVQLPIELKVNQELTEKFLLREAAKPYLTGTVYNRQKHPFLAPPAATSPSSSLYQLANDTFRSKNFADNPFYDQAKVLQMLEQVSKMSREEQSAVDGLIMATLSMAVLQDQMKLTC